MPLEIQNGKAVLWGIAGGSIEGYASIILQDGKLDHKFKLTAIEDENEYDTSLVGTNPHFETSLTWTPAGTTRAAAAESAVIPDPLAKITLSGFAATILNGDWIYIGDASINLSHAAAKMSLKVRKYADADQNASLTTTVS